MREIKFRQPIFVNGKFCEWHYWGCLKDGEFIGPVSAGNRSAQFTGLLDKNGNDIYEGDIISDGSIIDDFGCFHKALVVFKYGGFVLDNSNCKCGECCNAPIGKEAGECEVIGNIYENPDIIHASIYGEGEKVKKEEERNEM